MTRWAAPAALFFLLCTGIPTGAAEEKIEALDEDALVVFSKEKPAPEPQEGKALIVVVRPAKVG